MRKSRSISDMKCATKLHEADGILASHSHGEVGGSSVSPAERRDSGLLIASPTIGVMCSGDPTAPETWSGTPREVIDGLDELGLEVCSITVDAPWPIIPGVSLL